MSATTKRETCDACEGNGGFHNFRKCERGDCCKKPWRITDTCDRCCGTGIEPEPLPLLYGDPFEDPDYIPF